MSGQSTARNTLSRLEVAVVAGVHQRYENANFSAVFFCFSAENGLPTPATPARFSWRIQSARWVPSYLPVLLWLAGDTGRRIGAILSLRWADWRPDPGEHGTLRWRAEEDKVGREWWAPVTHEVRHALEQFRRERPGVGDGLLFPAPGVGSKPVSVEVATRWLRLAENRAGLKAQRGGAWHPYRRKWATERKHLSPKDVAAAGGWVDTTTLQKCYQTADWETMEAVVSHPRRLKRVAQ